MPIMAADTSKEYKLAPAGVFQGVCCDVTDLGMMDNPFKPGTKSHKIAISWMVFDEDDESSDRMPIVSRWYTCSLSEKATLRRDLDMWRGRPFTPEELKGFDLENLIGANCILVIAHVENSKGEPRATVASVSPIKKKDAKLAVPEGYVRRQDRPDYLPPEDFAKQRASQANGQPWVDPRDLAESPEITVDDIPF